MDDIDAAVTQAWNKLAPQLKRDRAEALRRAQRMMGTTLRRPLRPWCCCIRAADTRLALKAHIDPKDALRISAAHTLYLPASALRDLCTPVTLPWPGVHWLKAAAKIGVDPSVLRRWAARGLLQMRTQPARTARSRGKPVPFVWSPSPLDPNADRGQGPHEAWGTLWQHIHEDIPDEAELEVRRVHERSLEGRERAGQSWRFICPGLHAPCGRAVDRLYLPVPVWTLHRALVGAIEQPPPDIRWACRHCHRVKHPSFANESGWNDVISALTSGLLYGREVTPPPDLPWTRRSVYRPRRSRTAPQREQAQSLRAAGMTRKEIAREMRVPMTTVKSFLRQRRPSPRATSVGRDTAS
ncbi:MAG TPA: hypothetical protein VD971_12310 [Phycisphaerales bacterium]|nr:hypothetical protein [Phycisphaerales bacterium]